jgi:hypothetical protein
LEGELAILAGASRGTRKVTLNRCAFVLGWLVKAGAYLSAPSTSKERLIDFMLCRPKLNFGSEQERKRYPKRSL